MRLRFLRPLVIIGLAMILVSVLSGCSVTINSFTILPDCAGVTFTYSNAVADVFNYSVPGFPLQFDRTWVTVRDGAGNVLIDRVLVTVNVGATDLGDTKTYLWTKAPEFNPITVQILNKAGGDLSADRIIFEMSGSCRRLPWAGPVSYTDGRINRFDILPPVVVYPVDYGNGEMGMHIYTLDENSNGVFYMEITPAIIAAAGTGDWVHVISSADGTFNVHRMGEKWHMTALFGPGKTYVLTFDEISSVTPVESYTMDP